MSFWRRLFGREPPPAPRASAPRPAVEPPAPRDEEARAEADELARLRRLGEPGGADPRQAIGALRSSEGTPRQHRVLEAVLEGLARAGDVPAHEPLRVACARSLSDQGRRDRAVALLHTCRSADAMMLAAELHAAGGELARALGMIERVLARNIDTPGARERHERWSAQLGRIEHRHAADDGATVIAHETTRRPTTLVLLREVARGGAGTVYEAEDELLGRRVAFKVYHRVDRDREQIEREARTAVRLAGAGVLRVFDADPHQGWLAAEWIDHGSLRDVLRAGRVAEVLPLSGWLPRLLAALERVHAADLVHGDLKPANVLFRALDDPVIGDFGTCLPRGSTSLAGTPGYLSPERLSGGAAHPSDDVYALGRIVEDVLAAREDAGLAEDLLRASEAEARAWARIALACLAPATERPIHATAVAALVAPA